jgi:deaminated glutathione amidase
MAELVVATCQFPVARDVDANLGWVGRQLRLAARQGARVVHFPEGGLSGYAGSPFESFDAFGWDRLASATDAVCELASELGVWVVIGTAHRTEGAKPYNSLYVINDEGGRAERYDKRFCSDDPEETTGDLAHYSPGDHASVWEIDGVRAGALICHDYRYPELYRDYKRRGVQLVFHSFHAANVTREWRAAVGKEIGDELRATNPAATYTYPAITMPAAMTTAAACNHVWISCPNSSARESSWPAFMVRADGVTLARARRNTPSVLVNTVDTDLPLYDSTANWRAQAMSGVLHSGTIPSRP